MLGDLVTSRSPHPTTPNVLLSWESLPEDLGGKGRDMGNAGRVLTVGTDGALLCSAMGG